LREFSKGRGRSTMGRSQSVGASVMNRDSAKENPATTRKFEAYVESRRKDMEDKKLNEEGKFQEEIQRFFK
jgi:Skp family chaperone for outer membrane proteins